MSTQSTRRAIASILPIAKQEGGTPVIFRDAQGNEHPAIRLPDGTILHDCRRELSRLTHTLAELLRP
jgi:hypothetical protein